MSTVESYHYVYRITNIILNKHYYGKRSSKIDPKLDLGIKYFSSSIDKEFIQDQKGNPQNYKYKIVSCYSSAEKALVKEVKLHSKFNVGVNLNFYNRVKQTSTSFDRTGQKNNEYQKRKVSEKLSNPSPERRKKLSDCKKGIKNYNAKLANIYEYKTDKLLFANIVIHTWAKENNYNQGHLASTVRADRTKPHHWKNNMHYHKGIYARYIN